jgi:chromosome partitioning protein
MNTIAIISSKGGSGKTTTALNLSVALAEMGRACLLVDLDPQGAVGLSLAKDDLLWSGLAELIMGDIVVEDAIIQTKLPSLSLLSRGRLDPVDICEYEKALYSSNALAEMIAKLDGRYRYVIIDTPSGLGMITRAALAVSTHVLIPFQAEPLALRSIGQALRIVDHVKTKENQNLNLLGILPTMVQLGVDSSLSTMSTLWAGFEGVLESTIPRTEAFIEASYEGLPVGFMAGKKTPEARRYEILADEVETLMAGRAGRADDESPRRDLI